MSFQTSLLFSQAPTHPAPYYPPGVAECRAPYIGTIPLPSVPEYTLPAHLPEDDSSKFCRAPKIMARSISSHSQCECSTTWATDGQYFSTIGNSYRPLTPEGGTDSEGSVDGHDIPFGEWSSSSEPQNVSKKSAPAPSRLARPP